MQSTHARSPGRCGEILSKSVPSTVTTVASTVLRTAEEKEAVEQYGSSDSGASLGDILGAALKGDE